MAAASGAAVGSGPLKGMATAKEAKMATMEKEARMLASENLIGSKVRVEILFGEEDDLMSRVQNCSH